MNHSIKRGLQIAALSLVCTLPVTLAAHIHTTAPGAGTSVTLADPDAVVSYSTADRTDNWAWD